MSSLGSIKAEGGEEEKISQDLPLQELSGCLYFGENGLLQAFTWVLTIIPPTGSQSLEPTSWLKSKASLLLPFARDTAEDQGGQPTCPRKQRQGRSRAGRPRAPTSPGPPICKFTSLESPRAVGLTSRPGGLFGIPTHAASWAGPRAPGSQEASVCFFTHRVTWGSQDCRNKGTFEVLLPGAPTHVLPAQGKCAHGPDEPLGSGVSPGLLSEPFFLLSAARPRLPL